MYPRNQLIKFFIICLMLSLVSACDSGAPTPADKPESDDRTFKHSIFSFGTLIEISIYGVDLQTAERAFEQLEMDFRYMHVTWHPWQRSALSRDNKLIATTEWFSDAPSVRPLIEIAKELAVKSDHLFNPAIGKLIYLWGFKNAEHETGIPPAATDIEKLVVLNPRMDDLELREIQMRSNNPAVLIDLGGFAKGYGINRSMETLKTMGINHAVINAGGDLKVIGRHGNRPWRIGIRHPRIADQVLAYVEVEGEESVFTSGDYERYFIYQDKRYHHIIDPRTGYPANGSQSVTVIHADAALADAAATALFVAGPSDWQRVAQSMGIEDVLLVDANGELHMTESMRKKIQLPGNQPSAKNSSIKSTQAD